jgi:uncharacterized OB-fold protein
MLPEITPENAAFWAGGARGELMIVRCQACAQAIHPPQVICPVCLSTDVSAHAALGTGRILARTINRQPWSPDLAVPYTLAVVELDEEPGVRITARVVGCDPEAPRIGDEVKVDFEAAGEGVWIPVFRLAEG